MASRARLSCRLVVITKPSCRSAWVIDVAVASESVRVANLALNAPQTAFAREP
jgi:hypothetical protein